MSDCFSEILCKLETRQARVGVVGLGYVGLPVAVDFAQVGFQVVGVDNDELVIRGLRSGRSHIADITDARLVLSRDRLSFSSDYGQLASCDAVIVCVPTPLGKTKDPDLSYLVTAAEGVAGQMHPGLVVSLESTTYPGTTDELVAPILERQGYKIGEDFFLCFSPERIDPGRTDFTLTNTPKVVGGVTPRCLEVATALYQPVVGEVIRVSSSRTAEMVKLLENTYRAVNIALVNEMAIMCDMLGIDPWEVVEAAGTKPFGFQKFLPGPGVGGHCIPLDPHYLQWKLKTMNYHARFIQLAGEINAGMPAYWVEKVRDVLNLDSKPVRGSRIVLIGISYKKDVSDIRESPGLDILQLLSEKGAQVEYFDPFVPELAVGDFRRTCLPDLYEALKACDCAVVATDHSGIDWSRVSRTAPRIVDTRHVIKDRHRESPEATGGEETQPVPH